ncbi:MAG: hypothetical protein LBC29_04590, partial [Propionibacteriaceae bacterium]|nr:hypothetical protein [Propionibacteriaceae bacterium]
ALPASDLAVIDAVLSEFRAQGLQFHGLRTRSAGTQRFLDIHVIVPGDWSVARGHELAHKVADALRAHILGLAVVTHLEPIGAVTDDCVSPAPGVHGAETTDQSKAQEITKRFGTVDYQDAYDYKKLRQR